MTRPANPLAHLLGRPAASLSIAEIEALPELTAFGHKRNEPFVRIGRHWHIGGRNGSHLTSAELQATECVCTAVGETPEDALDRLLPRPTRPLHEIAEAAGLLERPPLSPGVRNLLRSASQAFAEWQRNPCDAACSVVVALLTAATHQHRLDTGASS